MTADGQKTLVSVEAARTQISQHAPDRLAAFEAAIAADRKIEAVQIWRDVLRDADSPPSP